MATTVASPIPLEEYMDTSYSPDCEYVDGVIIERNVGKGKHSFTQLRLGIKITEQTTSKKLVVLVEQRVKVSPTRVRIPDVCVVNKLEEIIVEPPLLCVEVLSPDDRWTRVNASISDYQALGAPCVWVIDPYSSRAWVFELDQPPAEVRDGLLTASSLEIRIPLSEVLP